MSWSFEPACSLDDERLHAGYQPLVETVQRHVREHPDDHYLRSHLAPEVLLNQVRLIRWYLRWVPEQGKLLDWGCRFAPDSFLLHRVRPGLELQGCDFPECARYRAIHEASGMTFTPLTDSVVLPYPDNSFDVVIAAGVLEHVAMDYESLKQLHRVLKPGGKLIITHLPYRRSRTELQNRQHNREFHRRLYGSVEANGLMLRTGFYPNKLDYQERVLRAEIATRMLKGVRSFIQRSRARLKWWAGNLLRPRSAHSALCGMAEKVIAM